MKWIYSSRGQNSASNPYQDQFGCSTQLSAEVQKKNKEESSEKIWLEKIGNVLILQWWIPQKVELWETHKKFTPLRMQSCEGKTL